MKAFNHHKGWGFVEMQGEDFFLHKSNAKGACPQKGETVQFNIRRTARGAAAVKVQVDPSPMNKYYGWIKHYNPERGFGFISSEAFEKDVFVLWSELPGGFALVGCPCIFNVSMDQRGPAARKVEFSGTAGRQFQDLWMAWNWSYSWGDGWCSKKATAQHWCKNMIK